MLAVVAAAVVASLITGVVIWVLIDGSGSPTPKVAKNTRKTDSSDPTDREPDPPSTSDSRDFSSRDSSSRDSSSRDSSSRDSSSRDFSSRDFSSRDFSSRDSSQKPAPPKDSGYGIFDPKTGTRDNSSTPPDSRDGGFPPDSRDGGSPFTKPVGKRDPASALREHLAGKVDEAKSFQQIREAGSVRIARPAPVDAGWELHLEVYLHNGSDQRLSFPELPLTKLLGGVPQDRSPRSIAVLLSGWQIEQSQAGEWMVVLDSRSSGPPIHPVFIAELEVAAGGDLELLFPPLNISQLRPGEYRVKLTFQDVTGSALKNQPVEVAFTVVESGGGDSKSFKKRKKGPDF